MQRPGNLLDVAEGDVTLAPFDQAEIAAVEAGQQCQPLLAEIRLQTQLPHAPPEPNLYRRS